MPRRVAITRVVLLVERNITSDTVSAGPYTLCSVMAGGVYLNDKGERVSMGGEDEPFSDCRCNGLRCILFLDPMAQSPISIPLERAYRRIDTFRAIWPISPKGKSSAFR